ncbi:hypothetical protein LCI18_002849 [Fusarium solani-melongenae]|uniref:Uncharacterized protein n=1 Tax=Fusarium solani subsp. cucurbitae TaxID=2747967 RepID=A0ACD3YSK1_FUSSC|nr:hypothetical protein LCI18_002849 [Fusarium solani-melongenae]
MPRATSEEGEVDHIDLTVNPEDLMDVDEDEDRAREESSLFLHSVTPPGVTLIDLVADDGEPDDETEIPRGRSDSSLFVRDDPEDEDEDEGTVDHESNNTDNVIDVVDDDMNDNDNNEDDDMIDNDVDNGMDGNGGNNNNGNGDGNGNGMNNNDHENDDDNNGENEDNEDNGDSDDSNDSDDNDDRVPSDQKKVDADLEEALEEEGIIEPDWAEGCLRTCKPHWDEVAHAILRYRRRFLLKRTELRNVKTSLRQQIRQLRQENQQLRARGQRRPHKKSWRRIVRLWVCGPLRPEGFRNWGDIYKLSCKEENMSWAFSTRKSSKMHPDLKLRAPDEEEEEEEGIVAISDDEEEESPDLGSVRGPLPNLPSPLGQSPSLGGPRQSSLERLPIKLQIKIFSYLFVFERELVHAISRLDPYYEPTEVPRNCNDRVSLLHRFHVGQESVSLTFGAIKPQELLAPLLGRFASGIGARLQHVQHVEILWMGSQCITYKPDDKCRYTSRRTHHLAWFSEARRLKSIAVYIPESSKQYMRRKHEPPHVIEYMADKTAGQPNYRRFRALRTIPGLDYLHVLRGLNGITFWDYDKWLEQSSKLPVCDWTFVSDLNNTVRRAKAEEDMRFCTLRRLAPFVIGYRPDDEIINEIGTFVNQFSPGCGGQVVDLTMDDD